MKAKELKLENGMYGAITYYAKKYAEYITRQFLWTDKCVQDENYIVYYDVDAVGYRRANITEDKQATITVKGVSQ